MGSSGAKGFYAGSVASIANINRPTVIEESKMTSFIPQKSYV